MSDWRGLTELVLAIGVTCAVVVLAIGAAIHRGPISPDEATLLATVLGAAIGALATLLGSRGDGWPRRPG